MLEYLWLVPALPLAGFFALFVTEGKLPDKIVAVIGAGSVGLAALVALGAGIEFVQSGEASYSQTLWTWMAVGNFAPSISLYLDPLSLVMTGVITGVGFLIHLFATGYMWKDHQEPEGLSRFFAYMNLFVFAMLMLVLGDNLLVLFLGWEGVGLCSYLLIGFYHRDPENGYAARKAFVVTRVGDTLMAIGLFLLFRELATLDIQTALGDAAQLDSGMATAIGLLLLGGAVGKSAQVPLQTWLPDAMAGPTPVSALIHAATMVTAGVYLIARMKGIYDLAPAAQFAVAIVGLVTLLISSFTALTQTDIKRILAYSTMSQIGYMFMALGVGAWSAGIFHLMTHAFFKALLFLASGSVILALHHEQDIFKMGGLWRKLPVPFASMLIGSGALVALPFITSGFYSKDAILLTAHGYEHHGGLFWFGGVLAAVMTALYTTRMMVVAFFGETKTEPHDSSRINMWGPLVVLCVLSIGGGWLGIGVLDGLLGPINEFSHAHPMALTTMILPLIGIFLGWPIFRGQIDLSRLVGSTFGDALRRFWQSGWAFDWVYDRLFVKPFVWVARVNKGDAVDLVFRITAAVTRGLHHIGALTQTGRLRWYAANMAIGLIVVVLIVASA
ncbi:MAG: NADH-quinone oxidoreductase subunit L [Gammaproteobacteria bacterium]|nr:NADH-quinone oxidoreductase subunit L [Gammaproteobacteria bacterium]MDE0442769.1 NADH-quinone oxidoreductase subunit L [Gammaproteobacteria bacterium]